MRHRAPFQSLQGSAEGTSLSVGLILAETIQQAVDAAVKPLKDQLAARQVEIEHLRAAFSGGAYDRQRLPPSITALLAKAAIALPQAGEKIPLGKLDDALKGLPIDRRITVKDGLAKAGLID
jgi:hypothetical protein